MRIVGGKFRRRQLTTPRGELTRPTTDRVRESIFNLVEARMDLDSAHVLDLFAGTGALGLEALSRGAASVTFVESDPRVLSSARANAEMLDASAQCRFLPGDAVLFLKRNGDSRFDLILADPPYSLPEMAELPDEALRSLGAKGLFVLEHDKRIFFDDHPALLTHRKYGRTVVSVFGAPAHES